jgi:predicted ATP-grasp superfamily ATP-dependent carboligase
VLQEQVPGPAGAIVHVSLYADKASNVRGLFMARKTRQFPSLFGNACMVETAVFPEIPGLVTPLIKAIGFHGIAGGIEFKRHPETGRLHFIEINPRAGASVSHSASSGVNLPYLAHLDALGAVLPEMTLGERSVRWIDGRRDLLYWLSYRKGDHTGQPLSLLDYLRSLRGRRDYAYWAADDPLPWLARLGNLPIDIRRAFASPYLQRTRAAR